MKNLNLNKYTNFKTFGNMLKCTDYNSQPDFKLLKNYIGGVMVFLICLLFTFPVNAQNERSKELIINNEKQYFKHIVKKGEDLEAISNLYNAPKNKIQEVNRDAILGLRVGQILKIPVIKGVNDEDIVTQNKKKIVFHQVKRKQTAYSIAKMYNVPLNEIYDLNPATKKGLKVGNMLKIPKSENNDTKIQIVEDDNYIYHKPQKNCSLKDLATEFDIEIIKIKSANPNIKNTIKKGEEIRIPKKKIISEEIVNSINDESTNVITNDILFNVNPDAPCDSFNYKEYDKPFKVALMLPLFLTQNETIGLDSREKPEENEFYKKSPIFLEFYEGVLMALDTLRKEGLNIELQIFDTEKDTSNIENIIVNNEEQLKQTDLSENLNKLIFNKNIVY
jgi:LysM repeat protein